MEPAYNNKIELSDGDLQWLSQKFGALEKLKTTLPTNSSWCQANFQNQCNVALKLIQTDSKKHLNQLLNSSEELMGLSHHGLLRIYSVDYLMQGEDKYLVALSFQLGEESLKTSLMKSPALETNAIVTTLYSAAQILNMVQTSRGLHHGNIKSTNFIKVGSFFKLSEFGDSEDILRARAAKDRKICAKFIDDDNGEIKESSSLLKNEYLSPEIRKNGCLSSDDNEEKNELFANDVYSLGIVLLEMFGNPVDKLRELSPGSTEHLALLKQFKEVVQTKGGIPLGELADKILDSDPSQRIAACELVDRLALCAQKMGYNLEQGIQDLLNDENPEDDSAQKFMIHMQALNKKLVEAQNLKTKYKFKEALTILEEHLLEAKKLRGLEEKIGQNLNLQSSCLLEMGKIEKAIDVASEALVLYDGLFGKENISSAGILFQMSSCYSQLGDKQKAIDYSSKALEIVKAIRGELNHNYCEYLSIRGIYHNDKAEFAEALDDLTRAEEIFEKLEGKKSIQVANILGTTAIVHKTMRNYQLALDCTQQAYALYKELKNSDLEAMYKLLLNLGGVQCLLRSYKEATKNLLKALEIGEKIYGPESLRLGSVLSNLGSASMNTKDYAKAEVYLKRGLEIRKKFLPHDSLQTAISLRNLASLYFKTGKVAEARVMFQNTLEIRKNKLGEEHPDTASVYYDLATCYHRESQFAKAVECYNKTIDIQRKYFSGRNEDIQGAIFDRDRAMAHKAFEGHGKCTIF